MNKVIDEICNYLERKRFLPIESESLIDDIIYFINNEKDLSITALNQELEALGWGIGVLDDNLYALTIPLLGNGSRNKTLRTIRWNTGNSMQGTSPSLLEKVLA